RGDEVDFAGAYYRVAAHRIHPRPLQRPHPPIIIGGNGLRLLTLAAKEADTVNLTGITFTKGGTTPDMSAWRVAGVDERMRLGRGGGGRGRGCRSAGGERADPARDRDRSPPRGGGRAGEPVEAVERRGRPRGSLRPDRHRGRDGRSSPRAPRALGALLFRHV